ncbi:MAG TPA: hypothetical protein VKG79_02665 [Bryobacteraceae bacterium]|nr:hypothetical protein [Bryobacteraceae bacterium]
MKKSAKSKTRSRPSRAAVVDLPKIDVSREEQAGDLQGLPGVEEGDSESVRELVEEGQFFEAEIVDAVENAPDPDVAEVTTREVPEDDVPAEYQDDPDRQR